MHTWTTQWLRSYDRAVITATSAEIVIKYVTYTITW